VGYDEAILAETATGGTGNHAFAVDPDQAAVAIAAEFDGLLSKTVQGASVLISPGEHVRAINVLNDLAAHAVDGKIMTDIGDLYAGERRRVVVAFDVPGIGSLGMVQVAELAFTYTALPALEQHTVTVPISVNVVPVDVAAGRVPRAEVVREKLLLSAQSGKRQAEEAIRRGDHRAAGETLRRSRERFEALGRPGAPDWDDRMRAEAEWLEQSMAMMNDASDEYMTRRLRADRTRKSRGHSRSQGGEVDPRDDTGTEG